MNNNDLEQKITRKKYSPQFKDQALERADKESVPQVATDLGLAESLLYSWRAQRKQGGNSLENQKLQQAELARYRERFATRDCIKKHVFEYIEIYYNRKRLHSMLGYKSPASFEIKKVA